MYRRILVPLDGSPLAEAALPHAQALAKSEDAEIIILRVPIVPDERFISNSPDFASAVAKKIEREARAYVNEEVSRLKSEGVKKVWGFTRDGPVPDTILAVAKETGADMIVMSTHGRTGFSRWLMGSVADRVVHCAHIPAMLIHPN